MDKRGLYKHEPLWIQFLYLIAAIIVDFRFTHQSLSGYNVTSWAIIDFDFNVPAPLKELMYVNESSLATTNTEECDNKLDSDSATWSLRRYSALSCCFFTEILFRRGDACSFFHTKFEETQ